MRLRRSPFRHTGPIRVILSGHGRFGPGIGAQGGARRAALSLGTALSVRTERRGREVVRAGLTADVRLTEVVDREAVDHVPATVAAEYLGPKNPGPKASAANAMLGLIAT